MRKAALALSLFAVTATFAQDGEVSFQSTEISPGIHMIEAVGGFGGGNMAVLVGSEHVAMIDDSMPPLAPLLLETATAAAGSDIDFMINTHFHGDHTGGNAHFAGTGTVVFAHDNIRKRLLENPDSAGGAGGMPVVTFAHGVTFHLDNIEARVMHLPTAHTDGDAIIVFPEANVIHTGDIWFHQLFPFIDLNGGGDVRGFLSAQKKIWELADDDTKIIPGHGVLGTKADLADDIAMLSSAIAAVEPLVADGMSEEEVVAANPLAEFAADYDWGFINAERMTRTIFADLTSE